MAETEKRVFHVHMGIFMKAYASIPYRQSIISDRQVFGNHARIFYSFASLDANKLNKFIYVHTCAICYKGILNYILIRTRIFSAPAWEFGQLIKLPLRKKIPFRFDICVEKVVE